MITNKSKQWKLWTEVKGTPPSTRNCHTSTIFNHYMIIFGGKEGEGHKRLVNDLHALDLENKEWLTNIQIRGNPPEPRTGHTAALYGKLIIIYGGWNGTKLLNDAHFLDLSEGIRNPEWQEIKPRGEPTRRQFHTANVIGTKMFVFGGGDGKLWLNDLSYLDLNTLEWRSCQASGNIPPGRLQHTAISVGRFIYIFGGEPDRHRQLNDMYVLDTKIYNWKQINFHGCMLPPSPRVSTTSCLINKTIYFFGGYDGTEWLNDTCSFDTEIQQWINPEISYEGEVPEPRCRHTSNFYQGKIIVFGGNDCDRSFNDLHILPIMERQTNIRESELVPHMKNLLEFSAFSDITFIVEGREIKAHKNILYTRCEHFKVMLTSGLRESIESVIEIPNISYDIFNAVLVFIYTDWVDLDDELAPRLLEAANMFLLKRLKNLCENYMAQIISLENLIDFICLAEIHHATELKRVCMEYAMEHFEIVVKLPNFENLSKKVMVELLQMI